MFHGAWARVPGAGPARSSGVHRLGSRRERAEFSRLAVYAAGSRRVHLNPSGERGSARSPHAYVAMPLGARRLTESARKSPILGEPALDGSEFHRSHSSSTSAYVLWRDSDPLDRT